LLDRQARLAGGAPAPRRPAARTSSARKQKGRLPCSVGRGALASAEPVFGLSRRAPDKAKVVPARGRTRGRENTRVPSNGFVRRLAFLMKAWAVCDAMLNREAVAARIDYADRAVSREADVEFREPRPLSRRRP